MKINCIKNLIPAPKDGQPGKDSISVEVNPAAIIHKIDTQENMEVTFSAYYGSSQISASDFDVVCGNIPKGMSCASAYQKDTYTWAIPIIFNDIRAQINGNLEFEIDISLYIDATYYNTSISKAVNITTVSDGQKGDPGNNGPWGYLAGEWQSDVRYSRSNDHFPIVSHNDALWYPGADGSSIGNEPSASSSFWKLLTKDDIIYAKIVMAEFGKLASAIFSGSFMLSQYGKLNGEIVDSNSPSKESAYTQFDAANPKNIRKFVPNLFIDFLSGLFHCTNAEIEGTINAIAGNIGGFSIASNGLTNLVDQNSMSKNNMGFVICRNDYYGRFAGIGANVMPASSGSACVARFENNDTHNWYTDNIGMIVGAKGKSGWSGLTRNIAMAVDGGCVSGFALNTRIVDCRSGNNICNLEARDNVVTAIGNYGCNIYMPTMRRYDDGHVLLFKRNGNLSYCRIFNGNYIDDSGVTRKSYMRINQGDTVVGSSYMDLGSWMDSCMFIFHSNLQVTVGSTTYYGEWIQYKLPRDW